MSMCMWVMRSWGMGMLCKGEWQWPWPLFCRLAFMAFLGPGGNVLQCLVPQKSCTDHTLGSTYVFQGERNCGGCVGTTRCSCSVHRKFTEDGANPGWGWCQSGEDLWWLGGGSGYLDRRIVGYPVHHNPSQAWTQRQVPRRGSLPPCWGVQGNRWHHSTVQWGKSDAAAVKVTTGPCGSGWPGQGGSDQWCLCTGSLHWGVASGGLHGMQQEAPLLSNYKLL